MPTISIIIPTYNPGDYLAVALASVHNQTVTDWELIVVDDGSPQDVSLITCQYPAVVLLRQKNHGQAAARNLGLYHARGDFIAFLDQDDVWKPTYLDSQLRSFENEKVALSHTQFEFIDAAGRVTSPGFARRQNYVEMLSGSGICGATTVVVRRTACMAVGSFDPMFEPAEDYDLWLRLARSYDTEYVASVQAQYRLHESNQTRRYRDTYNTIKLILQKHKLRADARGDCATARAAQKGQQVIRGTFACQAYDQCRECLRARKFSNSISHLGFAVAHHPAYVLRALVARTLSTK